MNNTPMWGAHARAKCQYRLKLVYGAGKKIQRPLFSRPLLQL